MRGHRRFVALAVMLAGFGALTAATVSNQPTPLVETSHGKPRVAPQGAWYCWRASDGSYVGVLVDKRGVARPIPCPYKYP